MTNLKKPKITYGPAKWTEPSIRMQLCYWFDGEWIYPECLIRPIPLRDKIVDDVEIMTTEELLPDKAYWEAEVARLREVHGLTLDAFGTLIVREYPNSL